MVSFQLSEERRREEPSAVSHQPEGGRASVGDRRRLFAGGTAWYPGRSLTLAVLLGDGGSVGRGDESAGKARVEQLSS